MSWEDSPDYGVKVGPVSIALTIALQVLILFAYASCWSAASAQARQVSGVATVTDGDTIRIGEDRIRLSGIDAPENGAMCGGDDVYAQSRAALAALTAQNTVECNVTSTDRYGRLLAICRVNGENLATQIVEQGWARDWARYSGGAYAQNEANARTAHRGIWAHDCPEIWGNRNYSR